MLWKPGVGGESMGPDLVWEAVLIPVGMASVGPSVQLPVTMAPTLVSALWFTGCFHMSHLPS